MSFLISFLYEIPAMKRNRSEDYSSIAFQTVLNDTNKLSLTAMSDKLDLPTLLPWALAFALVAVFVILGNSLVILCFIKKKSLRTHTNYFIVSLSIADLFVGVISAPWWIIIMFVKYHGEEWFDLLHNIWLVFDILGGVGSILHLIALSWDRLCAIVWPLKHRKYSSKSYLTVAILVWIIAITVSALAIVWWKEVIYHVTVIVLFFFVPLVVICVTQLVIVIFISKTILKTAIKSRLRKDIKVAKTIGIMIAIFVVGWFPFFGLSLFSYTNPAKKMSWHALFAVKLLQYGNSAMNPALYAHKFPHFRKAYIAILCSFLHVNKIVRPIRNWSSRFSGTSTMTSSTRVSIYGSVKTHHKEAAERRRLARQESFYEITGSPTIIQKDVNTILDRNFENVAVGQRCPESPNFNVFEKCEVKGISCGASILKTGSRSKYSSIKANEEESQNQKIVEFHDHKDNKKRAISFIS
jgi:hypothetical protein